MRVRRLTTMLASVPLGLGLTIGAAVVLPQQAQAASAPCGKTAKACLDLSANKAWLMNKGAVTYGPVQVTHGRPGYATPPGTFKVSFKDIDHKSSEFNGAPMPYSVFFNGGIAFHQGSLQQLSHGCVHLSKTAAQKFYSNLKPGDVVQVVR
jgi:L,D-transpeptidase catalytic domain